MNITIGNPWAVSEKGGRLNNEDSIFPLPETANSNQNLFLVCDGVGGAEKGEIASSLACESFQTFFSTFREGEPNADFINKAIRYTEARFDDYVAIHPEAKGMATTLTMTFVGTTGITLAHVGDSRIYHFRKGEILFQTEDHSLVNSLVKLGKITHEEVAHHGLSKGRTVRQRLMSYFWMISRLVIFCSCVRMVYSNVLTMMSFRIYSSI